MSQKFHLNLGGLTDGGSPDGMYGGGYFGGLFNFGKRWGGYSDRGRSLAGRDSPNRIWYPSAKRPKLPDVVARREH